MSLWPSGWDSFHWVTIFCTWQLNFKLKAFHMQHLTHRWLPWLPRAGQCTWKIDVWMQHTLGRYVEKNGWSSRSTLIPRNASDPLVLGGFLLENQSNNKCWSSSQFIRVCSWQTYLGKGQHSTKVYWIPLPTALLGFFILSFRGRLHLCTQPITVKYSPRYSI